MAYQFNQAYIQSVKAYSKSLLSFGPLLPFDTLEIFRPTTNTVILRTECYVSNHCHLSTKAIFRSTYGSVQTIFRCSGYPSISNSYVLFEIIRNYQLTRKLKYSVPKIDQTVSFMIKKKPYEP
ncbi:hypothetical protein Hdeb2414_s0492g00904821 [Helianthus debilis subsp. tardiflorus]